MVTQNDGRSDEETLRRHTDLYSQLCDCAGPQPSLNSDRSGAHAESCPYRVAVEQRAVEQRQTECSSDYGYCGVHGYH